MDKVTGTCIMLRHRSMSCVLQKTPEMHEMSRLSGQFDSCLFYYTIKLKKGQMLLLQVSSCGLVH